MIDSSVAIKWFVQERNTSKAFNILDNYQNGDLDFLAPDFIYAEFGNIIWKKQRLQGLPADQAQAAIAEFQQFRLSCTSTALLLNYAYQIATTHQRTVYDALYLALSIRENCQFVTADDKLVNAIAPSFPNVVKLSDWI